MHGEIVKFHDKIGYGVIKTEDGRKFRFAKTEVMNPNGKLVGYDVDFVLNERSPRKIVLMQGSPWTAFGGIHG